MLKAGSGVAVRMQSLELAYENRMTDKCLHGQSGVRDVVDIYGSRVNGKLPCLPKKPQLYWRPYDKQSREVDEVINSEENIQVWLDLHCLSSAVKIPQPDWTSLEIFYKNKSIPLQGTKWVVLNVEMM